MFNNAYIKHLNEEIKHLRELNKEYQKVIIALTDKQFQYNTVGYDQEDVSKKLVDEIKDKDPLTKTEEAEKQIAMEHLRELGLVWYY